MLRDALSNIDAGRDALLKFRGGVSDLSAVEQQGGDVVADMYTLNMESYHLETLYQVNENKSL